MVEWINQEVLLSCCAFAVAALQMRGGFGSCGPGSWGPGGGRATCDGNDYTAQGPPATRQSKHALRTPSPITWVVTDLPDPAASRKQAAG